MKTFKTFLTMLILVYFSNVCIGLCDRVELSDGFNTSAAYNPKTNLFLNVSNYEKIVGYTIVRGIQAQLIRPDGNSLGYLLPIAEIEKLPGYCLSKPDVIYNPDDNEFLIVWTVSTIEPYTTMYVQRVGPYGTLLGGRKVVEILGSLNTTSPKVAYNTINRHYLVCWESKAIQDQHKNILAKRIDRNGESRPYRAFSVASKSYDQINMDIAYNENSNEFLVVWEDHNAGSGADSDIRGRKINANGAISSEFLISWDDENHRSNPSVAFNPIKNAYFVVWDYEYSSEERDIFGRYISSSGTNLSNEIYISEPDQDEWKPAISVNTTNGEMLIAWLSHDGIKGMLLDKNGLEKRMMLIDRFAYTSTAVDSIFNSSQQTYLLTWDRGTGFGSGIHDLVVDKDGYSNIRAHIKTRNGHYWCAESGGGGPINATRTQALSWETFSIIDVNNGYLESGDVIFLKTVNNHFVTAELGGGSILNADRTAPRQWETFRIIKIDGDGIINLGDSVAFQARNGDYVCSEGGGGGDINANRAKVGSWETHKVLSAD